MMLSKRTLYFLLVVDIAAIVYIGVLMVNQIRPESVSAETGTHRPIAIPDAEQSETPDLAIQQSLPKSEKRKIRFQYRSSKPREVSVLGEFSDWEAIPMEKGSNHVWSAVVELNPGTYLYCYDVDGRLIPDPNNPNIQILSGNEKRSMLTVKPQAE